MRVTIEVPDHATVREEAQDDGRSLKNFPTKEVFEYAISTVAQLAADSLIMMLGAETFENGYSNYGFDGKMNSKPGPERWSFSYWASENWTSYSEYGSGASLKDALIALWKEVRGDDPLPDALATNAKELEVLQ